MQQLYIDVETLCVRRSYQTGLSKLYGKAALRTKILNKTW